MNQVKIIKQQNKTQSIKKASNKSVQNKKQSLKKESNKTTENKKNKLFTNQNKQLKFIHITKTAGTTIEDLGQEQNINWGKFHSEYSENTKSGSWWHDIIKMKSDSLKKKYDWFMVVRNPYERIISEFHCKWGGVGNDASKYNKDGFNEYVRNKINERKTYNSGHWVPQFKYFDKSTKTYILKFENLKKEFEELMKRYNFNIKLNKKENTSVKYFTIYDFDEETVSLIKEIYRKDFEMFGYSIEINKNAKFNLNAYGVCIYLVGLSGSGKTTTANALAEQIQKITNKNVSVLDGDIVREHLSKGLGFSKEDRSINVRRIGYVASEIVKHNGIVIVSNIAPFEEDRKYNRDLIEQFGFYIEVFVDTPLEICEARDVKGLYKKARQGLIPEFTGISSPFERPLNSEITLNGNGKLEDNIKQILSHVNNIK